MISFAASPSGSSSALPHGLSSPSCGRNSWSFSMGPIAMGIAEYFASEPLEWKPLQLDDETFQMLCAVGYNNDGECEY